MNKTKSILALALLSLLLLTGCTYRTGEPIGTIYQIGGPVKEVKVIGLVYVKCEPGEPVYQALLRAAEKKGGNGITNVTIDVEYMRTWFFWLPFFDRTTKYASALAIKYTNENLVSVDSSKGVLGIPSEKTFPMSPAKVNWEFQVK